MLDGLLGRGFASKCKSLIKITNTRIDVIRRKRNATQKFLRKDIADLLSNGLDMNAYRRAEGLLVEMIISSCYDFVQACCDVVLKHLSIMQKQRECPEECKTAVSSLMFAAARFSDLPDLRDLRQIFQERYGNFLDYSVNQEFVVNLASKPSTLENKIQLMKDIASEFSIKWDFEVFERMSRQSTFPQSSPQVRRPSQFNNDKFDSANGKEMMQKRDKHDVLLKERVSCNDVPKSCNEEVNGTKLGDQDCHTRHGQYGNGYKTPVTMDETYRKDGYDSIRGRKELIPDKQEAWNGKVNITGPHKKSNGEGKPADNYGVRHVVDSSSKDELATPKVKSYCNNVPACNYGVRHVDFSSNNELATPNVKSYCNNVPVDNYGVRDIVIESSNKDEVATSKVKSYCNNVPPPYVKPNGKAKDRKYVDQFGSHESGFHSYGTTSKDSSTLDQASARHIFKVTHMGSDHSDYESRFPRHPRVNSHDHNERDHIKPDDLIINSIPRPRSVRRKHSKSRLDRNEAGYSEDTGVGTRKSRSRSKRDDLQIGVQVLFDEEHSRYDEEEKIIDRMLVHYSKKTSIYEPGKLRRKSKSRHAHQNVIEVSDSSCNGSRDGPVEEPDIIPPPGRSVSLPHEQTGPSEAIKVFTRAASFQPEKSNPARHVHPNLPDYDDLADRIAALRGR